MRCAPAVEGGRCAPEEERSLGAPSRPGSGRRDRRKERRTPSRWRSALQPSTCGLSPWNRSTSRETGCKRPVRTPSRAVGRGDRLRGHAQRSRRQAAGTYLGLGHRSGAMRVRLRWRAAHRPSYTPAKSAYRPRRPAAGRRDLLRRAARAVHAAGLAPIGMPGSDLVEVVNVGPAPVGAVPRVWPSGRHTAACRRLRHPGAAAEATPSATRPTSSWLPAPPGERVASALLRSAVSTDPNGCMQPARTMLTVARRVTRTSGGGATTTSKVPNAGTAQGRTRRWSCISSAD